MFVNEIERVFATNEQYEITWFIKSKDLYHIDIEITEKVGDFKITKVLSNITFNDYEKLSEDTFSKMRERFGDKWDMFWSDKRIKIYPIEWKEDIEKDLQEQLLFNFS